MVNHQTDDEWIKALYDRRDHIDINLKMWRSNIDSALNERNQVNELIDKILKRR